MRLPGLVAVLLALFTAEVAVVTGPYIAQLRHPEGKEAAGRYRVTDTWLRRSGTWPCVATQETQVLPGSFAKTP